MLQMNKWKSHNLLLLLLLIMIKKSHGLIGYDYSQRITNLTTFSLLQVAECDLEEPKIKTSKVHIRLLQINEFESIHVKFCKIRIFRDVEKCGWLSHRLTKHRGMISYLIDISRDQCEQMHLHRQFKYRDEIIQNLKANNTVEYPMTFVGTIDEDGDCKNPGKWSDNYGTFEDVIVRGFLTISLLDYTATVNLNTNEVILNSGVRCKITDTECQDPEAGSAFWNTLPRGSCEEHKYIQLYNGGVNKILDEANEKHPTYVIESNDITFAFTSLGTTIECSHRLFRTEDPKLFILEGEDADDFHSVKTASVRNLDEFTYFNSKFVFMEKHIKGQIKRLYRDLLLHKCELERRVIQNALSIAVSAPDMFAFTITKKFGYYALTSGEVTHLCKCTQVEVSRRNASKCYQELPVEKDGKNLFLTPRTHILKQFGTEIACNALVPPMFLLGDSWYAVLPNYISSIKEPTILKPTTKRTWNYTDPVDLAKSGIYTYSDVQALRHQILFSVDRQAVLNNVALGVTGRKISSEGLSFAGLLDENALNKLADSTLTRMWGRFLTFGSASAGIIALFIIARFIKMIIDTMVHGFILYSIFGFSLHLIGAIWNSVTQLLIHLSNDWDKEEEAVKKTQDNLGESNKPNAPTAVNVERETVTYYPTNAKYYAEPIEINRDVPVNITANQMYPDLNRTIEPIPKRRRPDEGDDV